MVVWLLAEDVESFVPESQESLAPTGQSVDELTKVMTVYRRQWHSF